MYKDIILSELFTASKILNQFTKDKNQLNNIQKAAILISKTFKSGGKVISCGNGGSHCDAMHFSEELTGFYRKPRRGYPAITICDTSYLTCVSNDFGYENTFSRFVDSIGFEKDVLLGISTSGNSLNIIKAIKSARNKKMKVITLTGKDGGRAKNLADVEICVSHIGYSDRIQEIHIKILHIMVLLIEKEMIKN